MTGLFTRKGFAPAFKPSARGGSLRWPLTVGRYPALSWWDPPEAWSCEAPAQLLNDLVQDALIWFAESPMKLCTWTREYWRPGALRGDGWQGVTAHSAAVLGAEPMGAPMGPKSYPNHGRHCCSPSVKKYIVFLWLFAPASKLLQLLF